MKKDINDMKITQTQFDLYAKYVRWAFSQKSRIPSFISELLIQTKKSIPILYIGNYTEDYICIKPRHMREFKDRNNPNAKICQIMIGVDNWRPDITPESLKLKIKNTCENGNTSAHYKNVIQNLTPLEKAEFYTPDELGIVDSRDFILQQQYDDIDEKIKKFETKLKNGDFKGKLDVDYIISEIRYLKNQKTQTPRPKMKKYLPRQYRDHRLFVAFAVKKIQQNEIDPDKIERNITTHILHERNFQERICTGHNGCNFDSWVYGKSDYDEWALHDSSGIDLHRRVGAFAIEQRKSMDYELMSMRLQMYLQGMIVPSLGANWDDYSHEKNMRMKKLLQEFMREQTKPDDLSPTSRARFSHPNHIDYALNTKDQTPEQRVLNLLKKHNATTGYYL